jgi:hypothetical protein
LRLGAVFALLVGINVYVFFFSSGSLKKVSQAAQAASTKAEDPALVTPPAAPPTAAQGAPQGAAPMAGPGAVTPTTPGASRPAPRKRQIDGAVRDHESLGAALRREGLDAPQTDQVVRALSPLLDLRKDIRPGERYSLRYQADGKLTSFELRGATMVYAVVRGPDGKLVGNRAPRMQE